MPHLSTGWLLAGAAAAGLVTHILIVFVIAPRVARRPFAQAVVARTRRPGAALMPAVAVELALGAMQRATTLTRVVGHCADILLVGAVAWLAIEGSFVADDLLGSKFTLDPADNLRARRVRTQIQLLRRVATVIIVVTALAVVLLSFGRVRTLGASLLASAGLAGLVAGTAARPALGSVISGIQLAITQPFRIDDVIVVDGQWGRVEEIALTYVVLRLWDLRRLVLPVPYFLNKPFENWTRSRADLLGTVTLHVDYATPLDLMRSELAQLAESTPLWDRRTCLLQVLEAGPNTLLVRALLSARSASDSFDLCCFVREGLISWMAAHHPQYLPRLRTAPVGAAADGCG